MKRLSFTFSSSPIKNLMAWVLFFVFAVVCFDQIIFRVLFPFYDQWYRIRPAFKDSQILLVGSSHIEADLDIKLLHSITGKSVGIISIPGAGMIPRYYAIKERLEEKNVPPPEWVILETSRLVFHESRYFNDVSIPLLPYFHVDRFKDYLNQYGPKQRDWIWRKYFRVYSLNTSFARFTDPSNILRYFAENMLSPEKYLALRDKMRGAHFGPPPADLSRRDPRVEVWKAQKNSIERGNKLDQKKLAYFYKTLALLKEKNIKVILFDPPFYQFDDDHSEDYAPVIEILSKAQSDMIHYISLGIANDPSRYADGGHLTPQAQMEFTYRFWKDAKLPRSQRFIAGDNGTPVAE